LQPLVGDVVVRATEERCERSQGCVVAWPWRARDESQQRRPEFQQCIVAANEHAAPIVLELHRTGFDARQCFVAAVINGRQAPLLAAGPARLATRSRPFAHMLTLNSLCVKTLKRTINQSRNGLQLFAIESF
jgi:hypothetical protein